jgi:transposase
MRYYLQGGGIVRKQKPFRLTNKARNALQELISKGKEKARTLTRCRILLLADKGESDSEIIEALGVARNTARQVRQRYIKEGINAAIYERPRPGAPSKFSGRQIAQITALACSNAPEGRSRWSLRLLADKVVELNLVKDISYKTIERALKKTNLSLT